MFTRLIFKNLFSSLTWRIPAKENTIYLTFDDGPVPVITPWVVEILARYNAKATFFCVGANVRKYPDIFHQVLGAGHSIGNHTHDHINGWKTNSGEYCKNVSDCSSVVNSDLFRPPYGKLKFSQIRTLKKKFKIVMWDVLSMDYDAGLDGEQCFQRVIRNSKSGSIIVFHDSLKAESRMRYALPKVLEHFSNLNYRIEKIPFSQLH